MSELYCFGRFALDPIERRLYADGVPVPMGATDLRLLSALVESAGALVTKEDLFSRVWRRSAVSDDALYVRIRALRKVIGEECIVNKQGRGYRFVAPIQRAREAPPRGRDKPRTGNLPSLGRAGAAEGLTRLIGRGDELRVVSNLLARRRLVTLTGPGGVGKTKFALHAAGKGAAHFPDGVWLVELASLRDPGLVHGAVAAALGVDIGENAKPLDTLARHLARRTLLIVLDNCEHVTGAAAMLCEAILGAAPGARILATSREPLGCSGEQVFELPPLAPPRAIELFVERAAGADANFRMTDADAPTATRICRRVDGLPLAIEMVAGWAGVLGLETLDAKLDGSVKVWLRARTTAPSRHSTLRATLEWSHDLLSTAERTVLGRLAVFAGAFNLQAAEFVAGDETIPSEQIFEHVASLVRKSMIAVTPQAQSYRLLETTRALMGEKLGSSGDCESTRQRHAHYVLGVVENATAEHETTSDVVWKDRYGPILGDLRAALDWAMDAGSDDAVALAGASFPLWWELFLRAEGRRRLSAATTRLHPGTPPELEARLRRAVGTLWINTAAMNTAHAELERAAKLYREMGDLPGLGGALTYLGYAFVTLDRLDEAEAHIAEALKRLESARCPRMLATAYCTQWFIESRHGRVAAARAAVEKAVSLCEAVGADRTALTMAANTVEATLDSGDVDGAISVGRGLAARLRDTSHSYMLGYVLGILAGALTARGDLDEALTTAREAAPLLRDEGWLYWLFDHLALRSGLAGRVTDAALLAGYAKAVFRKVDHPREPMGRRAALRLGVLLHEALPEEEIARLGHMGAQFSEDQALTLALNA